MVPISSVAYLGHEVAPPLITLYNLYPSATVVGAPARGFSSGQSMAAMEQIAKTNAAEAMSAIEWSGMSYQEKLVGNQLYLCFRSVDPARLSLSSPGNMKAGSCHWRCSRRCRWRCWARSSH